MADHKTSKGTAYANAIIDALTGSALELGEPDFNAALAATVHVQGYLIAKLPGPDRLAAIATVRELVPVETAYWTAQNAKGSDPK